MAGGLRQTIVPPFHLCLLYSEQLEMTKRRSKSRSKSDPLPPTRLLQLRCEVTPPSDDNDSENGNIDGNNVGFPQITTINVKNQFELKQTGKSRRAVAAPASPQFLTPEFARKLSRGRGDDVESFSGQVRISNIAFLFYNFYGGMC